jgi:hypothetical protein
MPDGYLDADQGELKGQQNVRNWRNCIQDRKKWKDIVEKAKTYKG